MASPTAKSDSFDAIVVGGGMGGLTAGAMLAKAGMKTVLIEAAAHTGGCVREFERGGYSWDPAVHLALDPPHWQRLLRHFDVEDLVRFIEPPYLWRAVADDLAVAAPFGREAYIEVHAELFPEAGDEVRRFLGLCADTHEVLHTMIFQRGGMSALGDLMDKHPDVMRYRMATAGEVMDELLTHPDARALIAAPAFYLGLPPARLAFSAFSQLLFAHAADGAAYVEGGAQRIGDALETAFVRLGGEVMTETAVERILVSDDRAVGVALEDGQKIEAGSVISNVDPIQTFDRLLTGQELPLKFTRKLRRLTPSHSFFNTFAATQADLPSYENASHLTLYSTSRDSNASWKESFEGGPGYCCVAAPTLVPGARDDAPPGHHQLIATTAAPYDAGRPWEELEPRYSESALTVLGKLLPGLPDSFVYHETANPLTSERYMRVHHGAQFGWGNSPDAVGSRALDHATPIEGLFLAGAWTSPGSGFVRAAVTGRVAAMHILGRAGIAAEMPV